MTDTAHGGSMTVLDLAGLRRRRVTVIGVDTAATLPPLVTECVVVKLNEFGNVYAGLHSYWPRWPGLDLEAVRECSRPLIRASHTGAAAVGRQLLAQMRKGVVVVYDEAALDALRNSVPAFGNVQVAFAADLADAAGRFLDVGAPPADRAAPYSAAVQTAAMASFLEHELSKPDQRLWDEPPVRRALAVDDYRYILTRVCQQGFTQSRLASMVGMRQSEISNVINGRTILAVSVMRRIVDGLGIPPGYAGLAWCGCGHACTTPMPPPVPAEKASGQAHGLPVRKSRRYTDEELIQQLHSLASTLNRTPRPNDVRKAAAAGGIASRTTFQARFGGLTEALNVAGFEPEENTGSALGGGPDSISHQEEVDVPAPDQARHRPHT